MLHTFRTLVQCFCVWDIKYCCFSFQNRCASKVKAEPLLLTDAMNASTKWNTVTIWWPGNYTYPLNQCNSCVLFCKERFLMSICQQYYAMGNHFGISVYKNFLCYSFFCAYYRVLLWGKKIYLQKEIKVITLQVFCDFVFSGSSW